MASTLSGTVQTAVAGSPPAKPKRANSTTTTSSASSSATASPSPSPNPLRRSPSNSKPSTVSVAANPPVKPANMSPMSSMDTLVVPDNTTSSSGLRDSGYGEVKEDDDASSSTNIATSTQSSSQFLQPDALPGMPPVVPRPKIKSALKSPSSSPRTSAVIVDGTLLGSNTSSQEGGLSVEDVKKVNFWGWVDVGFSHSTDEYDRTPIDPEPLTREGALEVIQMRLDMRKQTQDLLAWRDDYEKALVAANITALPIHAIHPELVVTPPQDGSGADTSALQSFQATHPPALPPQQVPPPSRRPQYPRPEYPQKMYPRQSPMSTIPESSTSSTPSSSSSSTSASQSSSPAPPTKPPKPSRLSLQPQPRPSSSSSSSFLPRPHSHHDNLEENSAFTTAGPAAAAKSPSASNSIVGFMGRMVPGARWSWNEAVAQQHRKQQQNQNDE